MKNCIFCKIAKKEIQSQIVQEDKNTVAFKDIKPKAPIHILIIPKKHIISVDHLAEKDKALIGGLILFAKKFARKRRLKGYELAIHVGRAGGQLVDHLHIHLLAGNGKKITD